MAWADWPKTGDEGGAGGRPRARGTKKAWKPRERSTLPSSETWTDLCFVVVEEIFFASFGRWAGLEYEGFCCGGEGELEQVLVGGDGVKKQGDKAGRSGWGW